jgi:TonB family protein
MHTLSRRQQKSFYFILGVTFSLHFAFLLVQIRDELKVSQWVRPDAIKVKLIQEAAKEMALNQKRQIVQSEESEIKEKRDNAFLSDKDRSFERETISKNVDTFKKAGKGSSSTSQVEQKSESAKKKSQPLKDLKLADIGLSTGDPLPKKMARSPASASVKGQENGDPRDQGLSATNDYVQEMKLGDFTHLNTVEYKHYGFFHRIRQKLEQFWGNSIQEKSRALFRAGRSIASQDYVTSLQVTLNTSGEIIAVKIMGASGVKELDDAAVESFNKAGPFPNPPKDLLVNGKATIEWGFVVKS